MKRLALLAAALLLLCACTSPGLPAPTAAPTEAPATAAPTEVPTTSAPTETPAPTEPPETKPTPTPPPEAEATLTAGGREYPAYRFSGDLTGNGDHDFSCLLPLEAVSAEYAHNAWVFRCEETPESYLELSFIAGGDVESLLPGFMDGYLDFTSIEFSEAASLGRVRGDVGRVTAENGERLADAWLLDVSGGTAAAVLLCPLPASEEEALLRAMLETFTLR